MSRRIERVEKHLQRIIGQIIDEELSPNAMVSVTDVSCDAGLTDALISVSIYAPEDDDVASAMLYLEQRASFVRREVSARANMRRTPKIRFVLETSMKDGQSMIDLISEVASRQ